MVRAPCCQKEGVKKGPWSVEEDQILVDYIRKYGHGNWRALPKQAGLLRCGKSCRLRWINYLRPDIKRGNFTKEEEDAIISLHEKLGNRWSAIAAMLPGRTDNEIKNVWNTHLKKRVHPEEVTQVSKKKKTKRHAKTNPESEPANMQPDPDAADQRDDDSTSSSNLMPASLEQSNSDFSYAMSGDVIADNMGVKEAESFSLEGIDESFWLEALSIDNSAELMNLASLEVPPAAAVRDTSSSICSTNICDMEFWLKIYREAEHLESLAHMNPADIQVV